MTSVEQNVNIRIGDKDQQLRVLVIGTGFAAAFAALALRRSGHVVELFEPPSSDSPINNRNDTIQLTPGLNGLLRRVGVKAEDLGAVPCKWESQYGVDGELLSLTNLTHLTNDFPNPWQFLHYGDLYHSLKDLGLSNKGEGIPISTYPGKRIAALNTTDSTVTVDDGSIYSGDLIIVVNNMELIEPGLSDSLQHHPQAPYSNFSHFFISIADIKNDVQTSHFVERAGELRVLNGNNWKIIISMSRSTYLGVLCVSQHGLFKPSARGWEVPSSDGALQTLPKDVELLLSKVGQGNVTFWKNRYALPEDTDLTKERAIFLYKFARGLSCNHNDGENMAVQGAAALAAILAKETQVSELDNCLKLYERAHHELSAMLKKSLNRMDSRNIEFSYDAFDHGHGILQRELVRKAQYCRIPISFGPCPSPRQDLRGKVRRAGSSTSQTAYVKFKTPKSYLSAMLPSGDFEITNSEGWAEATFAATKLGNLEWLGGRGYSYFAFLIHNVRYTPSNPSLSPTPEDRSSREGDFQAAIFENMADPIITGREELGFCKIFATLDSTLDECDGSYDLQAGWEGTQFCRMSLRGIETLPAIPIEHATPMMHYKVAPSARWRQTIDTEYLTMPQAPYPAKGLQRRWRASSAEISFTKLDGAELEQAFPTLSNVVKGLRGLKIGEVVDCGIKATP